MKYFICIFFLLLLFNAIDISAQTKQQLEKINVFVQDQQLKNHIPGLAVCIVHDSNIAFAKGYGKTSAGKSVTIHTPFAIASLSKAFTATAVLQLAEHGKINIDLSAANYISNLPPQLKNITVRELLNQTSGLSDKVFPELKFKQQPDNLDNSINRLKNVQLQDKPGTKFQYHNPNYQLLAKIVEAASGQSFNDYLKEHLFQPLNMNETHGYSSTKDFYKSEFTNGYSFLFGHAYAMKEPDWFVEGAAGITSSVNDMAHWMMLNLQQGKYGNDTLLTGKSISVMQSAPIYLNSSYGMGWIIGSDSVIGHDGILWTYQSGLLLMRKQGYGIVALFNSGLNAFQDYSVFTSGISKILSDKTPTVNNMFTWMNRIVIGCIAIVFLCAFIRFKRMEKWKSKANKVSKVGCIINIIFRLFPLLVLLFVPALLTTMSGRVLSWQRIFYIIPEIACLLILLSLFNLSVIAVRFNIYKKIFRRVRQNT